MTKDVQKITLSPSRDIPFDKLVLSQSNVRRVTAGVSVAELAEDIARRGLLAEASASGPSSAGDGTGDRQVRGAGRRPPISRARSLLVKARSAWPRPTPVPCNRPRRGVGDLWPTTMPRPRTCQRDALHPLDQFRAFKSLVAAGQASERRRATPPRFFVPAADRAASACKLASVAPALLEVYAEDGMTLDQLDGPFTVHRLITPGTGSRSGM